MELRSEGIAFIKTKTDANPNFWSEFADKIRIDGYVWRYEEFLAQTNLIEAVKCDIIDLINYNSNFEFPLKCIIFNFYEYEYEYAFYNEEQYDEESINRALRKAWSKKYPGKKMTT